MLAGNFPLVLEVAGLCWLLIVGMNATRWGTRIPNSAALQQSHLREWKGIFHFLVMKY